MSLVSRSHSFQLLREPKGKIILALIAAAALVGFGWLFWSVSKTFQPSASQLLRAGATAISVPIILLWFHNREKLSGRQRMMAWILVLGIAAVFAAGSALTILLNIIDPPEWDFLVFWLDGQVAVRGLNFYEPASYQNFPLPISPSPSFKPEILDVGFKYPPPTMLLFMPLGLLDFRVGIGLWYAAHGAILGLCVALLWKTFLDKYGLAGLVLAVALVAVIAGTFSTLQFAQTSFLALLMVLLFWRNRERLRGGMWLILGALVKPFLLILLMVPILRKQGRVLLGALITVGFVSALTLALVGWDTFLTYITDNPAGRAADFLYVETTNQSLLATILRLSEFDIDYRSALIHPVYIATAAILTAITGWLLYSLGDEFAHWGLSLALILALIVYPATQIFYSVLLIVPIAMLWEGRNKLPTGVWGTGTLITVVLVLITIGGFVFFANVLLWVAVAALSSWVLLNSRLQPRGQKQKRRHEESAQSTIKQPLESLQ